MPRQITSLTLADARRLIAAGEREAEELDIPYNIAVVDSGGSLIAHARMDGAWLGSIDISIKKAWTARAFDMATADLSRSAQPNQSLYGIHATNGGTVVIFGGGVPVKVEGVVVGAVGASGGGVEEDLRVALAAATAMSG
jgi:uncharacterized protein GlcG (DUF336 family)